MLVAAQVSSINTSFSTSIAGCASPHARRAACTSSRSCSLACSVFFERQIPLVQLMPKCADFDHHTPRRQPLLQLGKSQFPARLRSSRAKLTLLPPAGTGDDRRSENCCVPRSLARGLALGRHRSGLLQSGARSPKGLLLGTKRKKHTITQILRIRLHPHLPLADRRIIARNVDT